MDPDFIFLAGVAILSLAIPATISAFSTSGATMRVPMVCVIAGGSLVAWASITTPGGYTLDDVPRLLMALIG